MTITDKKLFWVNDEKSPRMLSLAYLVCLTQDTGPITLRARGDVVIVEPGVMPHDLWTMLLSTFRYSMRRSTYMPSECVALFDKYAAVLTPEQRKQIVAEVATELNLAECTGKKVGMDCDHVTWADFVAANTK